VKLDVKIDDEGSCISFLFYRNSAGTVVGLRQLFGRDVIARPRHSIPEKLVTLGYRECDRDFADGTFGICVD
jgi:hypothetical protein